MAVVISGGNPVTVNRTTELSPGRGAISLYGGQVQTFAELYRCQPNLRLVIRFLGRNVAQLPLHLFERIDDKNRRRITDGPAGLWLDAPDAVATKPVTRHRWIDSMIQDLALYDVFLAIKMRNVDGRLSTVRIPPTHFLPIGDSWLWPDGFRVFGNSGWKDYSPDEVIYLHGHHPENPKIGSSSAEALRRTLAEDAASGRSREQMWNNAGRQSGYIKRPGPPVAPKWSDEARARFEKDFHAKWAGDGPGAGGTPILEEGMEYVATAFSAKELEYLGARRLTREEVAAQYFVPPVFVGILENANFANVREQHRSLYSDTLGPWLDWIPGELEVQLLPDLGAPPATYFEFRIEEKLRGSFEEEAAAIQTSTGAPWMLRSEARAMKNLPPVPGFDEPITPLNVLIGGQASPTDSAPGRGGAAARPAPAGAKALPHYLRGWEAKHLEIVTGFFTRQKAAVLSRLGAGAELADAFDSDRWNTELRTDLYAAALSMATDVGGAMATDHGATFDPALVEGWLGENARIAAEGINSATVAALSTAVSGVPRRGASSAKRTVHQALQDVGLVDDGEDPETVDDLTSNVDPAAEVFDLAIGVRAIQIATSRTTAVGSFARNEGASQAGLRTKTWISSGASNSRHADLDGETVAIGDTFSNGGLWPGDPALGVEETAGCQCSIDFGI